MAISFSGEAVMDNALDAPTDGRVWRDLWRWHLTLAESAFTIRG